MPLSREPRPSRWVVALALLGCGLGALAPGCMGEAGRLDTDDRDAGGRPPPDAGRDAGEPPTDAGSNDAGSTDAGVPDAGSLDAGSTDAGANDGGSADAGPTDAGFDAGVVPSDGGLVIDQIFKVAPDSNLLYQTASNRDFLKPVWNGARWVLFWERIDKSCVNPAGPNNLSCTITARSLMATVLRPDGSTESVNLVYTLDPYQNPYRDLDAIPTATGYLATWVEPTGPQLDAMTTIHLLATDAAFTTVHHESFSAGGGWWPKLAGKSGTYALFWQEHTPHQQDWFAPLSWDGKRGTKVQVSMFVPRLAHHLTTEMAFDGTNFGLLYESDAERLVRCGCNWSTNGDPVEVFLQVLSPAGSRLSTTRLSEGIEEGMETMTGNYLAARPAGGFAATWVSTVSGAKDVVFAEVSASGQKIGANVYLTRDGQGTIETNPRISAVTGGYLVSHAFVNSTTIYDYGVALTRLGSQGAPLGSITLVPPPPQCGVFQGFPSFTGPRCAMYTRGLGLAAAGTSAVTTWLSSAWTALPGDSSGETIITHLGSVAFTHW